MGIFTGPIRENLQTISGQTYVPSLAEADRYQRLASQDGALTAATLRSALDTVRQKTGSRTLAEYGRLDPAEATYFYPGNEEYQVRSETSGTSWPYYAPPGVMGAPGLPSEPGDPQDFTVDTVPDELPGEDEVFRGEHVHAKDGDIGRVQGIAVDPATGRVTFVLLRTGRLWSHRAVLVPRSAVAEVGADGFHLGITVQQVRDLPPADTNHPAS